MTVTAGIGPMILDHVVRLDQFPREDETAVIREHARSIGGAIPQRLRLQRQLGWGCRLLATVGDDVAGKTLKRELLASNIDSTWLLSRSGESGFAYVWLSTATATRTIAYSTGDLEGILPSDVPDDFLAGIDIVQLDGREAAAGVAVAEQCRARGITISCDLGNRPTADRLRLVPGSDIVQVSARFAATYMPNEKLSTVAERLHLQGAGLVVVTDGIRGCWFHGADGNGHASAFDVDSSASLGAGDIFGGALTYAWHQSRSIPDSLTFASAAAGMWCLGSMRSAWSVAAIDDFVARNPRRTAD